ncbi:PqqD family protein [Halothermothrix orenii]|uniref:Coenzyme PQQ synthesis D n=1 Tax=Halothermothrix orenii (strain H 168 / OCM 544 / DSM 9562) TaxID=373903 RepID=B8CX46_HALOH|nr:PqqD family protein [Halothermothrix orenii]ACL69865.1 hypothetical protein Hore_11120 [Halothermothrix orenii H 168]
MPRKKNLLEMKPRRRENIDWQEDEDGNLTLIIKRNGWIDRIFQKVFKTPKQTTLELDKVGSFVWLECDGNQDLNQIAKKLKKQYPEEAAPVYDRLVTFIGILKNNGLITLK